MLNEGVDETEPTQFTINVIPINDSPSFTVGDTISVLEDSGLYSQSSWATDINDGDWELVQELSFSIISNDNALLFSEAPSVDANGNITFTVNENQSGLANIILTLVDNGSGISPNSNTSEEKQFVINVIPVNDIPAWTVGERIEILEDSAPKIL